MPMSLRLDCVKHGTLETPDKDSLVLTSMLVDAYNCVGSVSSLAAVQSSIDTQ